MLDVRIEPKGPAAERGVARLSASGAAQRDPDAMLGEPAATAQCVDGEAAIALLVQAAELALEDTDLHITLHRR